MTLVKFRSKGSSPTIAAWPWVTVYSGAWPSELAETEACVSSSSTWPSVNPVYRWPSAAQEGKKVSAEAPLTLPLP